MTFFKISTVDLTVTTNPRWRFRNNLWFSQNIWPLMPKTSISWKSVLIYLFKIPSQVLKSEKFYPVKKFILNTSKFISIMTLALWYHGRFSHSNLSGDKVQTDFHEIEVLGLRCTIGSGSKGLGSDHWSRLLVRQPTQFPIGTGTPAGM